MNSFIAIGNMTKDIENRSNEKGDLFGRFNLAIQRDRDREKTDFMRCVAFGKTAELLGKYTHKGSKIAVQGRIQTGEYEKEGIKHFTTDVMVDSIQFLDKKEPENVSPYDMQEKVEETANEDMPF